MLSSTLVFLTSNRTAFRGKRNCPQMVVNASTVLGDFILFKCSNLQYTRFQPLSLVQSCFFLFVLSAEEYLEQRNVIHRWGEKSPAASTLWCESRIIAVRPLFPSIPQTQASPISFVFLNESGWPLVRGCWLSPWGTARLHPPLPRRRRPARGEEAPGGWGRAACAPGRRPASGCRRSRGWCNARPVWSPAPAGPAMPDSPEQREEGMKLQPQELQITTNGLLLRLEGIIR